MHIFNFFHFFKEEDDEVTDEDNTSSDDGYPKDKKTCFMCKECFPTFSRLTQHQVLCKNTLKCPKCPCTGADYKLVKNFVCHTKLCDGDGSFRCPHCSKVFHDYNLARNHNYWCQSKRICHICNFTASSAEAMKKHVQKYHKRFSCKKCNYHCLDSGTLTYHMQTKHKKHHRIGVTCRTLIFFFIVIFFIYFFFAKIQKGNHWENAQEFMKVSIE